MGGVEVREAARKEIDRAAPALVELSHIIHAHPELAFEEERSSAWVAAALADAGLDVQRGVCDLPTAFVATAGTGPLTVAICAEYDALPGIGHACGHNIIAAAAVGAGLALAPLADELGITVKVMGTPAEEGGGGKILMLQRGGFAGVNAAMMVHPGPIEMVQLECLAVSHFDVFFHGKEAHASAFPERGVNAADALTIAQVAVGLLRQHFHPGNQVHGIVTKGGEAPNIVPAETSAKYYVRARTLRELESLEPRVHRCLEAGAVGTGTTFDIRHASPPYSEFEPDDDMLRVYRRCAEDVGRQFPDRTELDFKGGSTDMANVSLAMPAIHPMLGIDSLPAVNHQPEFAAACVTPVADQAVAQGALAMAWTTIELAREGALRDRLLATRA